MHNFSWTAGTVFWLFVLCRCQSVLAQGETPNDPAYRRYPADPHQESLFLLDMEQAWKLEKGSPQVLVAVVVRVHNEGSVAAERVAVILHHHEPAVAQRTGAASRMIEAQVVAVPAAGAGAAEFLVEDRAVLCWAMGIDSKTVGLGARASSFI